MRLDPSRVMQALERLDACSGGGLTLEFVESVADSWPPRGDDPENPDALNPPSWPLATPYFRYFAVNTNVTFLLFQLKTLSGELVRFVMKHFVKIVNRILWVGFELLSIVSCGWFLVCWNCLSNFGDTLNHTYKVTCIPDFVSFFVVRLNFLLLCVLYVRVAPKWSVRIFDLIINERGASYWKFSRGKKGLVCCVFVCRRFWACWEQQERI